MQFICKLTQTVLEKSEETLIILDDDVQRLIKLDEKLWTFSNASFLPHDLCVSTSDDELPHNKPSEESIAPVILTDNLPSGFDGIILNLATEGIHLPNLSVQPVSEAEPLPVVNPARLLEIIPADEINKEKGRQKYRFYQSLGHELQVHNIG